MIPVVAVALNDGSAVGEARREAVLLASRLGFDETQSGRVAVVATELASNVIKHARNGEFIAHAPLQGDGTLEMLALDKGPGISNLAQSMRDGYSSAGTRGTGLGAVARLSEQFQVHTLPGVGTAILVRLIARRSEQKRASLAIGAINVPLRGEVVSGDGIALAELAGRTVILVVDGLGHGPDAHRAAQAAIEAFYKDVGLDVVPLMKRIHDALHHTRGAAGAIASIEPGRNVVRYTGTGNVVGTIVQGEKTSNMISLPGTLGAETRTMQEFSYAWPGRDAHLIMHTDGLNGRWNIHNHAGLAARDPALIAAVLYRDHGRGRDDTTVLVATEAPAA